MVEIYRLQPAARRQDGGRARRGAAIAVAAARSPARVLRSPRREDRGRRQRDAGPRVDRGRRGIRPRRPDRPRLGRRLRGASIASDTCGRPGAARPRHRRGLRGLQPAAGAQGAARRRVPVAVPDDDAADPGQRDVAGPVPGEADHAAGRHARGRRARDRRRPPRSPHRAGDARRVRIARRGVQHDGRRAGDEPAAARTTRASRWSARTSSSTRAGATSRRCSSASRRASSRSAPTGASAPSTAPPGACSTSTPASSDRRPRRCSAARICSRSPRSSGR